MLSVVFDFSELKSKNEEELSFANLLMRDVAAIILSADELEVKKYLRRHDLNSASVTIENISVENFLCRRNHAADWFLLVSDKIIDCAKYGEQFAQCPYTFSDLPARFESQSFTEHAKKKLLYNELSWLYMDSIANDTLQEVDFLRKIFEASHAKKILDCCCGVGRHAVRLGAHGFKVTGVDASEAQIKTAEQQNKNDNVEYFVHDVRDFVLPEKNYDAAICMWTTYNYFSKEDDLNAVLSNLWSHMRAGGLLVLDSKNIPALDKERLYHRKSQRNDLDMTLLVYKRIIASVQMSKYLYFINSGGRKNFYLDEEFVRFYSLKELQEINRSRFEPVRVYGDFDGHSFDAEHSNRMITVWKKIS